MQSICAHGRSRDRVILGLFLLAALAVALVFGAAPVAEAAARAKPGAALDATLSGVQPLRQGFNTKDVAAARLPLTPLGEASHGLIHAYYDNGLATAHSGAQVPGMSAAVGKMATPAAIDSMAMATPAAIDSMAMPAAKSDPPIAGGSAVNESEPPGHGEDAEATTASAATKGLVLGGFGAVNGLVIAAAAVFKTRTIRKAKGKAAARVETVRAGVTR